MFKYYLCMGEMQIVLESVKPLCLGDRAAVFQTERDLADICYSIEARIVLPEGKLIYSSADYQVYENGTEQYRVFSGSRDRIVLKRSKEAPCHSRIYADEETLQELQSVLVTRYLALEEPFLSCHAFLLHASLIRWGTHGIAFTAPSGIGKSTQAELWRQYQGADVLNGDRALLRNAGQEIRAYGSVFAGSSGIYRNESVRLSAVIVLEQAAENELTQLWGARAFSRLYSQILSNPWSSEFVERLSKELQIMLERVPVYLLRCRPDAGAVELVKQELERITQTER